MFYPPAVENTDELISIRNGDPGSVGTGIAGENKCLSVGDFFSDNLLRGPVRSLVAVGREEEMIGSKGVVGDGAHGEVNGQ